MLDDWPQKLKANFCGLKPPNVWDYVMAATGNAQGWATCDQIW